MARLLSFMCVILYIAVTLDAGVAARYLRDSFDLTSEEGSTPSTLSYRTDRSGARNLGGLVGRQKPDLSKFGLPPLPDFNPLDFLKQLSSGDLLKGLSNPSSSGSGGAGVSAIGSVPGGNARNLGGLSLLSGLQKPDLSKFGLPPLPDFASLAKQFASGGSAMKNARHLGGLPKLPKIPDSPLDLLPVPLDELPKPKLPIDLFSEPQRPFDLLPMPEFDLPKRFDLNSLLSNIFARKLDYDQMILRRERRFARKNAKKENAPAPAPAPAPTQNKKLSAAPSVNPSVLQQTPNTKPVPQQQQQQPMNQGMPQGNSGGQQPMNRGMPQGNSGGQQPMNPGMPRGNSGGQQPMNPGMPQGNSGGQQPMNLGMPQGMSNQLQPQNTANPWWRLH